MERLAKVVYEIGLTPPFDLTTAGGMRTLSKQAGDPEDMS
jgi:hypothetical protein